MIIGREFCLSLNDATERLSRKMFVRVVDLPDNAQPDKLSSEQIRELLAFLDEPAFDSAYNEKAPQSCDCRAFFVCLEFTETATGHTSHRSNAGWILPDRPEGERAIVLEMVPPAEFQSAFGNWRLK